MAGRAPLGEPTPRPSTFFLRKLGDGITKKVEQSAGAEFDRRMVVMTKEVQSFTKRFARATPSAVQPETRRAFTINLPFEALNGVRCCHQRHWPKRPVAEANSAIS